MGKNKEEKYIEIDPPPFNPGILGGVRQEIFEKYFTWPREL